MPSSLSLRSVLHDPESRAARVLTWIIRELTACVFIFSGFVKAIDPWGTLYKVQDYLNVMHLNIWPNMVTVGVFFLCGIEFLLGVFLALGCFRRGTAICTLLFMCFMLPLTIWIAIWNPVQDCGCFGEAFILSNQATLVKNIILTLFSIWLVKYNIHCHWLVTPALQWLALLTSAAFIFLIELFGYIYQPLIDFRDYSIGTSLVSDDDEDSESDEPEFIFTYQKDGINKDFTIDNLPNDDEEWVFVNRKEITRDTKSTSNTETEKEFHIRDLNDNDVTEDVFTGAHDMIILTMPEMKNLSIATVWKINSLYDWANSRNIEMIGIAAGSRDEIYIWEDLSNPEYPIYTSDDTSIKELVRGNPGVLYLNKGIIKWKSSLRALDSNDFMTDRSIENPMDLARNDHKILRNLCLIYLGFMILWVLASFTPAVHRALHKSKGDPEAVSDTESDQEGKKTDISLCPESDVNDNTKNENSDIKR